MARRYPRATVIALLLTLAAIAFVAAPRAFANVWDWPNGGEQAPTRIVERPDGTFESFPARCTVYEDGSARCPDWDGKPGAEDVSTQMEHRAAQIAQELRKLTAATEALAKTVRAAGGGS